MDGRPTAATPKHNYPSPSWNRSVSTSTAATPRQLQSTLCESSSPQVSSQLDLSTFLLFPPSPSLYQAQIEQYNKLISPGRGGGGLQTAPLPPVLSAPHIQAAPRSRSSSKVSNKDKHPRPGIQACHANKTTLKSEKTDRPVVTAKDKEQPKPVAPPKHAEMAHPLPTRPGNPNRPGHGPTHSSSVPSTPLQHARDFGLGSREPSPNNIHGHSPRSAFSETISTNKHANGRHEGCKYEIASQVGKRRFPYSIGNDKLPREDLDKIKSSLSEDEDRRLTAAIMEEYKRLLPTDKVEDKRKRLVDKLIKLFNTAWPGNDIQVHLFGSSANLLCSDDSDVDICITTQWKDLNVCMISALLASKGMEEVICVRAAKVPIVKVKDPETGLHCDMNINNTLALENTRMVRTYVEIDPRVRPLIMVIKQWTRQKVINEAGVGGTLSSYTWICMIISFLQLRDPPVLPALHQRQREKLKRPDGTIGPFADNVDTLRGFGKANKESEGALLFHFLRFYAHEFDYDSHVLSVRLGKLTSKESKGWHVATNNCLCVEEPFTEGRNLGNTMDDYSFKGVHTEIRKAFDLVGKLDMPEFLKKEEPKDEEIKGGRSSIFQKPEKSRPILVRSASQNHNRGRGGYRGGRGAWKSSNNGNSRRASSSVGYESPVYPQPPPVPLTPQQQFIYQSQQSQSQFYHDMLNTAMAVNMRMMDYQSQAIMAQQMWERLQHQQSQQQQQQPQQQQADTDRSRTNSFDNPPLSAPLRPDLYMFGLPQHPFTSQPSQGGHSTHPSSPSASAATPAEYRRSLHRTAALAESGNNMRSQSQPASRSNPAQGYTSAVQPLPAVSYFQPRHLNGVTMPSFIPDESVEQDADDSHHTSGDHPQENDAKVSLGYRPDGGSSPAKPPVPMSNGIPAFGDLGQSNQSRRRLSTDSPQTILDRRMKRTSRSPSPLGHARAFSVGTNSAPLVSAPFPQNGSKLAIRESAPLVVNGSSMRATSSASSSRLPSTGDSFASEDAVYDNPLRISYGQGQSEQLRNGVPATTPPAHPDSPMVVTERPLVVNGTTPPALAQSSQRTPETYSFDRRMPTVPNFQHSPYTMAPSDSVNGSVRSSPTNRQRMMSRQQQGGGMIAPLDLAVGAEQPSAPELQQHLSPVWETRSPSPTCHRKFEQPTTNGQTSISSGHGRPSGSVSKGANKGSVDNSGKKSDPSSQSGSRVNGVHTKDTGHGRKGDHDNHGNSGTWQKAKQRKRGGGSESKNQPQPFPQSERLPANNEERKGG